MQINNFEQIQSLLVFDDNGDWFYHLQILLRNKDMPEASKGRNNNARCIKTYYITSVDYLVEKQEEIIKLCENFGARAYINLNAKNFKKAAFELNKQLAERLQYEQYKHCYRLYEKVVGGGYEEDLEDPLNPIVKDESSKINVGEKRWIIDIDEKAIPYKLIMDIELCSPITYPLYDNENQAFIGNSKIIATIPTKSGWHLITKPFNLNQFKDKYPGVDLQKNNPTVLYFKYND